MAIDYFAESEKYRPATITTLLVGEAPPASGKTYFYVPRKLSLSKPTEGDSSLPATIFNHYFHRRPKDVDEYDTFLLKLKDAGIFLIDICDDPIMVRNSPAGVARIIMDIPRLRNKLKGCNIDVPDEQITFLLARNRYRTHVTREFPFSRCPYWKQFRMETTPTPLC